MQALLGEILKRYQADTGTIHMLEGDTLVLRAHAGIPEHVTKIIARVESKASKTSVFEDQLADQSAAEATAQPAGNAPMMPLLNGQPVGGHGLA